MKNKRKVNGCWNCKYRYIHEDGAHRSLCCVHDGTKRPEVTAHIWNEPEFMEKQIVERAKWDDAHEVREYEICDYWEERK